MRSRALLCAFLAVLSFLFPGVAQAQVCPLPSDTFWKNDILPDVPAGPLQISIILGLCPGEAAATYFQKPPMTAPQKIKSVSVGFGHTSGGAGFTATCNVEIYEGAVTFNPGGTAILGPKIFDLGVDQQASMQLTSTGINTLDVSNFNIVVDDDYVVAFRMNINPNGQCATGYPANFFTDNNGAPATCNPGTNLIFILQQGWNDPATVSVSGFPLCPLFYAGNWVIRACTEDTGALASTMARNGTGCNPNGFQSLTNPALGSTWVSTIDIAGPGATASIISFSLGGPTAFKIAGQVSGELLGLPPYVKPANVAFGAHAIPIPFDLSLVGATIPALGATFFLAGNTIVLNNAIDLTFGF